VTVALHRSGLGALTTLSSNQCGRLGLDQILEHHLDRRTDHIHTIGGIQGIK
jgi:hypothetical protein